MISEDRIREILVLLRMMKEGAQHKAVRSAESKENDRFQYWTGFNDGIEAAEDQLTKVLDYL